MRVALGCESDSRGGPWGDGHMYDLGGEITKRCPLSLAMNPYAHAVIELYVHWKRGFLPVEGSLDSQTSYFMSSISMADKLENGSQDWYSKEIDKRRRKNGK